MRKVSGFTLIELLVVILILGILAATALPKFIDLSSNARDAALSGIKGAIESGSAINFAAKMAASTSAVAVQLCTNAGLQALMQSGTMPAGVSISATTAIVTTTGTVGTCTIEYSASGVTSNSTFSVIAVSV